MRSATAAVTVTADPGACSFQFDPIGKEKFESTGCDIAKALAKAGHQLSQYRGARHRDAAHVQIGARADRPRSAADSPRNDRAPPRSPIPRSSPSRAAEAGYPAKADPPRSTSRWSSRSSSTLVLLVTMVYGPIAALLVELFPSRIRYTAMSLPYHIGNGWFGGFLPTTAFAMVAATGNIYYGLWYPVTLAVLTLIVGLIFLPETFRRKIHE
jgi:hypothetical protein